MDKQFLLLRSPRTSNVKAEVFDFYSGTLVDWDGQSNEDRNTALLRAWNGEKIQTFSTSGKPITLEEIMSYLADFQLVKANESECKSSLSSDFSDQIERIQQGISQQDFEKVVLSKVKWVDFEQPLIIEELMKNFKEACIKYPHSLVYLLSTKEHGLWMGASPEILIERNGRNMRTMSLAGTLFSDEENWSEKEMQEQAITAQHISECFSELELTEKVSEVTEITNGNIRHLVQEHRADMKDLSMGQVLSRLHPTPAVAGYPVGQSVQMISALEQHTRALYTGFIGNTQEVYVNLRCAQLFSNGIKLYAGCGINAQSNSEREWQETELKMRVMGDLFVL
jgi:isochorismate synthase